MRKSIEISGAGRVVSPVIQFVSPKTHKKMVDHASLPRSDMPRSVPMDSPTEGQISDFSLTTESPKNASAERNQEIHSNPIPMLPYPSFPSMAAPNYTKGKGFMSKTVLNMKIAELAETTEITKLKSDIEVMSLTIEQIQNELKVLLIYFTLCID